MSRSPAILLVDDEPHMLRLLQFSLREVPAVLHTALSGIGALEILGKNPIDFVVLDYEMPGFNGAQTLSEIRKIPGLGKIPVMILTSKDQTILRQQSGMMQCAAFMTKPFSPSELAAVVRQLVCSASGG